MRRRFTANECFTKTFDFSNYLTIEALEDDFIVSFSNDIEYGIDGKGWIKLKAEYKTQPINVGQTLSFRGNLSPSDLSGIGAFTIGKKCNLKGNIMSMLYGDDSKGKNDLSGKTYAFYHLFYNCTTIIDASKLILPATTLEDYCYCNMFYYCTSLTSAPELPAMTLAPYCYSHMFYNCTSLVTAPELHAPILASNCYGYMFNGCRSLKSITMLATNIDARNCLYYWVYGVASTGTFAKYPFMNSLPNGVSGIPSGWTVGNYQSDQSGGSGS